LAGLLHPSGELSFVELVVRMDVEVAHFLVLAACTNEPEGARRKGSLASISRDYVKAIAGFAGGIQRTTAMV
jgi:hypothetical protein